MTIFAFLVCVRWIHFASVVVLFGSALFWFYAGLNFNARQPLRGFAATCRLIRIAALLAALSGLAWLAGIVVNMTSNSPTPDWSSLRDSETLRLFFFETNFGLVSIIRLGLLAGALALAALPIQGRVSLGAFALLGTGLLISQAWLGHAAEGGGGLLGTAMISAYVVHVLAAAAWVGGLPPLLFVLADRRRGAKDPAGENVKILYRFSAMGVTAVAFIILSGVVNAGFRVGGSFARLLGTAYGDVPCVKLGLVALMLALALYNRLVAMPRSRGGVVASAAQPNTLYRNAIVELAFGVVVLGVAAVLGVTPPPQ